MKDRLLDTFRKNIASNCVNPVHVMLVLRSSLWALMFTQEHTAGRQCFWDSFFLTLAATKPKTPKRKAKTLFFDRSAALFPHTD